MPASAGLVMGPMTAFSVSGLAITETVVPTGTREAAITTGNVPGRGTFTSMRPRNPTGFGGTSTPFTDTMRSAGWFGMKTCRGFTTKLMTPGVAFAVGKVSDEAPRAQRVLGRLGQTCGELVAADEHLSEALSTFASIDCRFEVGRTHLELGVLAHTRADTEAAARHLREARDLFVTLRVPAYVDRAERLAAGGA